MKSDSYFSMHGAVLGLLMPFVGGRYEAGSSQLPKEVESVTRNQVRTGIAFQPHAEGWECTSAGQEPTFEEG